MISVGYILLFMLPTFCVKILSNALDYFKNKTQKFFC